MAENRSHSPSGNPENNSHPPSENLVNGISTSAENTQAPNSPAREDDYDTELEFDEEAFRQLYLEEVARQWNARYRLLHRNDHLPNGHDDASERPLTHRIILRDDLELLEPYYGIDPNWLEFEGGPYNYEEDLPNIENDLLVYGDIQNENPQHDEVEDDSGVATMENVTAAATAEASGSEVTFLLLCFR
ncbi:unnamed protein product [Haemonchus placei]|uniref:DUF3402 domain-containing protein n=1 Tax=Haemonchus placei TaxID=6290 RepID=A0A0N4X230_HAEPC|nr:unnamed protein product [Haemonchus placei]